MIGGLLFATITTLYFVPVMYSFLRKREPIDRDKRIEEEYHEGERGRDGEPAPAHA